MHIIPIVDRAAIRMDRTGGIVFMIERLMRLLASRGIMVHRLGYSTKGPPRKHVPREMTPCRHR
jgi:hypothetical protein